MVFQIAAAPLHALGYPDAANLISWSMSILHIRAHKWASTPFQLVPWEMFVATLVLAGIALASGTWVAIAWTPKLALLIFFTSTFGTVLPYWAVASAGRRMPASSVSLGLLATPIVGIIAATVALGEAPDAVVWTAMALVTGGVLIGTRGPQTAPVSPSSPVPLPPAAPPPPSR